MTCHDMNPSDSDRQILIVNRHLVYLFTPAVYPIHASTLLSVLSTCPFCQSGDKRTKCTSGQMDILGHKRIKLKKGKKGPMERNEKKDFPIVLPSLYCFKRDDQ